MKGKIFTVLVVTGLLLCTFLPTISTANQHQPAQSIDEIETIQQTQSTEALVSCTIYGYDNENIMQNNQISRGEAAYLLSLLQTYQTLQKNGDAINALKTQEQLLGFAEEKNLLPEGFSSSFSPPRIFTLLEPLMSRGATQTQRTGSEWFCNLVSFGEGSAVPIIVLPRLVPIVLLPIPRVFMKWSAQQGYTSVGGLSSKTGFLAEGEHEGVAWGFWGVGFSIFLPPIMNYGLFGYSFFAQVNAEEIEFYPPNYAPEITPMYPESNSENIPIDTTEICFQLYDANDDMMNYSISTNPDIGSASAQNAQSGEYSFSIENLQGTKDYSWTITVDDGDKTSEETYFFSTEKHAPEILDIYPKDDETCIPIETDELVFSVSDPQEDSMTVTVETTPNIGSYSQSGLNDCVVKVPISDLEKNNEYKWFINATDGENWKREIYTFNTENIHVFNPFQEGWQYCKEISINEQYVQKSQQKFPILVYCGSDQDIKSASQSDGDDLLFMNGAGVATKLPHEIETYQPNSGEMVCWVNIPYLSADETTTIYLYYGNQQSDNQQEPELVWDDNYLGVWHMNPEEGLIKDSTKTQNHGTIHNVQTEEGKIGSALSFSGDQSFVDCSPFTPIDDITLECWAYKDIWLENEPEQKLVNCYDTEYSADWYAIAYHKNAEDKLRLYVDTGKDQGDLKYAGVEIAGTTGWHYIVGSRDLLNQQLTIQIDEGILSEYTPISGLDLTSLHTHNLRFGARKDTYREQFTGLIDEIRISNIARSPSWMITSYNTVNFKDSFCEFGSEQTN